MFILDPNDDDPGREIRHVYGEVTAENTVIRNHRPGDYTDFVEENKEDLVDVSKIHFLFD